MSQTVFIIFAFLFLGLYVSAQIPQVTLSGTVYDENGAVITNAEIMVVGSDKILRATATNVEGVYEIKMPIGDTAIQIKADGFQTYYLEKYRISNSSKGKMVFDMVLEVSNPEPCGYGGAGCIPMSEVEIDKDKIKISDEILPKPLEELPKNQKKSNRKINNKR